jgi:hypothetical protein
MAMSNYQTQWERYRVRRRWIIAFTIIEFLGFIPIVGIVGLLTNKFLGRNLWVLAAIFYGALYLFTGSRLRVLCCP